MGMGFNKAIFCRNIKPGITFEASKIQQQQNKKRNLQFSFFSLSLQAIIYSNIDFSIAA